MLEMFANHQILVIIPTYNYYIKIKHISEKFNNLLNRKLIKSIGLANI